VTKQEGYEDFRERLMRRSVVKPFDDVLRCVVYWYHTGRYGTPEASVPFETDRVIKLLADYLQGDMWIMESPMFNMLSQIFLSSLNPHDETEMDGLMRNKALSDLCEYLTTYRYPQYLKGE
jgi:hypothetical protein